MSFVLFCTISWSGAFGFGPYTKGNIFDSLSNCGVLYLDVINMLYALVLYLAFPLSLQAPRLSFISL